MTLLDDMRSYEPLAEMPERVVQLVEEMIKDRENIDESTDKPTKAGSNGKNIVLNIWDFAGQAVYYTTHQVSFVLLCP